MIKRLFLLTIFVFVSFSVGCALTENQGSPPSHDDNLDIDIRRVPIGEHEYITQYRVTIDSEPTEELLEVHFIDVGQGDSIFLRTPDSKTALIDGGPDNGRALAYLQQIGITHLDMVIVSHPHADHIGGLAAILAAIPISGVWTTGAVHNTETFEAWLDAVIEQQIPYHEVQAGDRLPLGSLTFEVLYGQPQAPSLNNTSLVLHLTFGSVSFLFTGDIESPDETWLVEHVPEQLDSTILKVPHHGSYTSSTPDFLTAVQPEIAVYSAGLNNEYGHPHAGTLSNLATSGVHIWGTDKDGTIIITTDGSNYTVRSVNTPVGQPAVKPTPLDPFGRDRDCGAFATHAEAQAFFIAAGGPEQDPHRLDGDNDGIACEHLPGRK